MPGARTAATVVLVACATTFMARLATAGAAGQEPRPAAGQSVAMLRTWAVLASEELRKSGLEDQVLVGLGADSTITLVDRQHLYLVARELALVSLLDSSGAGFRRKAGAAVKADALVILHLESTDGKPYVRLVICETRGGVRLRVELIPLEDGKSDEAGKAIVSAIQDVRKHFAQGVKRVYGVPPFVSRCLTHEYDYLQRGYSSLLANALSQQPGVAVIEVEEARQIAREIGLTDGKDIERLVPSFIEGEYEVARNPDDKEPTVAIRIRISDSRSDERTLPAREIRLSEAVKYIGVELPNVLAGLEKPGPPETLTFEQQAETLVSRADVFARLGAWEHSTGLREAALLLEDNPRQRIRLVEEYIRRIGLALPAGMKAGEGEAYLTLCRERWEAYRLALPHITYLVCNQQVDPQWTTHIVRDRLRGTAFSWIEHAEPEVLVQADRARRRFVRAVHAPLARMGLQSYLWGIAFGRKDQKELTTEDLDFFYDLLEHEFPEDVHWRPSFQYYLQRFDVSEEQFQGFLDRLAQSDCLANRILALWVAVDRTWAVAKIGKASLEPLLDKVKALEANLLADPNIKRDNPEGIAQVRGLRQKIEDLIRKSQMKPSKPATLPKVEEPKPPVPDVTFREIPMEVLKISGTRVSLKTQSWEASGFRHPMRLLNCGNFDVMWQEGVLLLHRRKGLLEEIVVDPKAMFGDVIWDGKFIWAGMRRGEILLLSDQGKEVLRVGPQHGLPPCEEALRLHPLEQGKAVAIGSFGPNNRLWCAVVQIGPEGPHVKVFHQATRVKGSEDPEEDQGQDLAGCPTSDFEHQWYWQEPKVLIVGRGSVWGVSHPNPLEINLETFQVRVLPKRFSGGSDGIFSWSGFVLHRFNSDLVLTTPPRDEGITMRLAEANAGLLYKPYMLYWKGRVYLPGEPWFRVELGTWRVERLHEERSPCRLGCRIFGLSAHYGIVRWGHSMGAGYWQAIIPDAETNPGTARDSLEGKDASAASHSVSVTP